MNVLIVYAHPEPLSMSHALLQAARERFEAGGWQVEVSDLYAEGFNPVPSRNDFLSLRYPARFSLAHEQAHAQATRNYSADILREQDRVARADLIVFQFPLWWYAVPAILKGWAERVLGKQFAYGDQNMFDNGLLKGKKAVLSMTTGGTRDELDADRHRTGTVEQFLKPFTGGVLEFCGIEVLKPFVAYAVGGMDAVERQQELVRLRRHMGQVMDGMHPAHGRADVAGAGAERRPVGLNARALGRVQEYVLAHLHEPITLQTLAELANVSRFHFARMFKERAGMSPMTYLENARMRRAQELIRAGKLPLARVASSVGYEDQSYFTRRFKLLFGQTPAAYAREQARTGARPELA